MVKHYSPFVCYVLLLNNTYYYVGCHCTSKPYLSEYDIIDRSSNFLKYAEKRKRITRKEYHYAVDLLHVEEFSNYQDAIDHEGVLINKYKHQYGNKCVNRKSPNKEIIDYNKLFTSCPSLA